MERRTTLFVLLLSMLSAVLATCGDDAADTTAAVADATTTVATTSPSTFSTATTTSGAPPTTSTTTTTTTAPPTTSTTTSTSTTTTSTTTTTTTLPTPTGPLPDNLLPGTAFDLSPAEGAVLSVVGVQYDDVLNVRHAPGTNYAIVDTLAPTANDFAATGRARMLTQSIWWEVITADDIYGWVSSRFTAREGPTGDGTSFVVERLGGIPDAADMAALGLQVAETFAPGDQDVNTSIVMVVAPSLGDLGEVTYDVVGLADDTTHALRIHVFGQPANGSFSLMSAEITEMCDSVRGAAEPGGQCV